MTLKSPDQSCSDQKWLVAASTEASYHQILQGAGFMKRDMDLVRDLLLRIEALTGRVGTNYLLEGWDDDMRLPGWEPDMVNHHLQMLADGNLIELCREQPAGAGVVTTGLSWEGRDFLDTVRDPDVWKRTKEGASKMGGWTFGLIKELGTAYLKHLAKERLGLDL